MKRRQFKRCDFALNNMNLEEDMSALIENVQTLMRNVSHTLLLLSSLPVSFRSTNIDTFLFEDTVVRERVTVKHRGAGLVIKPVICISLIRSWRGGAGVWKKPHKGNAEVGKSLTSPIWILSSPPPPLFPSALPPSLAPSFSSWSVFYCCETQRCLLTYTNVLAGGKNIQHLRAMQTLLDFAKTQIIKTDFSLLSPAKSFINAFFLFLSPLSSLPPYPTSCPHLPLLSLFNDSIILT